MCKIQHENILKRPIWVSFVDILLLSVVSEQGSSLIVAQSVSVKKLSV